MKYTKHALPFLSIGFIVLAILLPMQSFAKAADNPSGFEKAAMKADNCANKPTIKIGYVTWAEGIFEVKLVKQLLEHHYGCNVKLQLLSVGVEYKALAGGDIDMMFEAWFPDNHKAYWQKVSTDVWDLGPLFMGAMNGWVVPNYIPKSKLNSIKDLHKKSVRQKLGGKIQGIDPGSGIMQMSETTLKTYHLQNYHLQAASDTAMTAALKRATANHEWIVVTLWTPHWAFGRFDLRFLQDPKKTLGKPQHSDKLVRQGFYRDYPKVTAMLARLHIPLSVLQQAMYGAQKTSYKKAVQKFIQGHPHMVHYWMTGDLGGQSTTKKAANSE